MLLALDQATVLGIAAAVSTLIGAVLAVASYIANRRSAAEKANEEQFKQLLEARAESERLSAELHKYKMGKDDETTQ